MAISTHETDRWAALADPRRRVGHLVEHHTVIGSTNDRARELLALPDGDGAVVVADHQTAGRGRRGRTWLSAPRAGLAVSVALRPRVPATDGWSISAAAALALLGAARPDASLSVSWPNDVVAADGRKVAGILVETAIDGEALREAIIGIGVNVSWSPAEMPPELAGRATSLDERAGHAIDRIALFARLLDVLDAEMRLVEAGVSPLDRYRAACATIGADVRVEVGDQVFIGRAEAIDDHGALVVATLDGRRTVTSGDVVRLHRGGRA